MLEEHLAVGWEYSAEVIIDTPAGEAAPRVPRILGRLEPAGAGTCRLAGTTSNPWWYAEQLAALPVAFRIVGGPEVCHTVRMLGQRLLAAGEGAAGEGTAP